jgi:hypothetical protein
MLHAAILAEVAGSRSFMASRSWGTLQPSRAARPQARSGMLSVAPVFTSDLRGRVSPFQQMGWLRGPGTGGGPVSTGHPQAADRAVHHGERDGATSVTIGPRAR